VFWEQTTPSLNEGTFVAAWTLQHAIETAPGGIAGPINIATLQMVKGQASAKLLPESELKEHYEAIGAAEDRLREFRSEQKPGPAEPEPPTPPTG
jgi:hypothetical protein